MSRLRRWLSQNWIVLALPVGLYFLTRTYHTSPPAAPERTRFTVGTATGRGTARFTVRNVAYTCTSPAQPRPSNRR